MAKVERRYSRKVGDSFRRDREHLALFEELSMHEDLDSSLGNSSLFLSLRLLSRSIIPTEWCH